MINKKKEMFEMMAEQTELILETDSRRKDLKEQRSIVKQTLYEGSKKLKHSIPKGKRI